MTEKDVIDLIDEMPMREFHLNVMRKVASRRDFGHLVCAGARDLSTEEREAVIQALASVGLRPQTGDDL